ncbi:ras and Rab interactor 3 [Discoglossus pictus]
MSDTGAGTGMDSQHTGSPADVKDSEKPHLAPARSVRPPTSGISILDRLIRTCPVWLQLCMSQEQAVEILTGEATGVFLVTRDVDLKCMVLWANFPGHKEGSDVLRYNIKEEKSMLYLEGSILVFEDIFKLSAFYCVSRDILPSTLKLPQAISGAQSLQDLETISNLGTGFWESSLTNRRRLRNSQSKKIAENGDIQNNSVTQGQHVPGEPKDCTCEIEICRGSDRLWFVNPIFIEECSNTETTDKLPLANCVTKPENTTPKIVYRRPPPPPPLHNPPLPSIPPSAPPPNYVLSPTQSSMRNLPLPPPPAPPLSPVNTSLLQSTPILNESVLLCSSPESSTSPSLPGSPSPQVPSIPPSSHSLSHTPPLPVVQENSTPLKGLPEIATIICTEEHLDGKTSHEMKINSLESNKEGAGDDLGQSGAQSHKEAKASHTTGFPPVVPRRRQTGKLSVSKSHSLGKKEGAFKKERQTSLSVMSALEPQSNNQFNSDLKIQENKETASQQQKSTPTGKGKKSPPVPPPRIKKLSYKLATESSIHGQSVAKQKSNVQRHSVPSNLLHNCTSTQATSAGKTKTGDKILSSQELKGSNTSSVATQDHNSEQDTYSTSSNEDESDRFSSPSIKKTNSFMLERAKNRLSMASFSNVFSAFMSSDRKLQKRITELAQDKESYFGNLVQDYKAYSLEMMAKQSSSTEMLQEIRLMMTQLKSYLAQSTEMKSMVDQTLYTDEKIEAIIEAALCKCVLKPLKAPIESYLRDIHNKDGSLRLLTENQLVIQDTTTTDLGVTTSVPESSVMEKITQKFATMHKTYSPEKKITYLLKSCKIIYDSMATGSPGKPHGADDFLPVLMYVLARCDLVALLLDVEYMMELMDPALQLGEGSYYLTTTYGALEHIKNYDKITVTRQLSVEVQDSIHRWERRRTLNKAQVSRSSVQDFITISFEEPDSKSRTLVTKPDTSVALVLQQCAEKFDVSEPQNYGLFLFVEDKTLRLAEDALPHKVKSRLLKSEQKLDFYFLYKLTSPEDTVIKEPDFL